MILVNQSHASGSVDMQEYLPLKRKMQMEESDINNARMRDNGSSKRDFRKWLWPKLQELLLSIYGQQRGLKSWSLSKNVNSMEVAVTILTTAWS